MLERVDLIQALERDEYNKQLKTLQAELHELAFQVYAQKRPVVIVFEGMDASGKGGTIKRLTELSRERVLADGQKLQHSATAQIDVQRPNKLGARMASARSERQLIFDGKTITL